MLSSAVAGIFLTFGMISMLLGGPFEPIGDWFGDNVVPIMNDIAPLYAMSG